MAKTFERITEKEILKLVIQQMEGQKMQGTSDKVSRSGPAPGPCKHSNQHSGPKKDGEFLDQLRDYQLLTNVSSSRC
jgi:hypothetical protein